eukprot:TRINITY_DN5514_c0_g1_i1.p1 TRINITY_DN5514_c0_g1~~TRINITY_DN5514_c0_g1_i1.p1  ORF type:complete len:169 (-),score=14.26 TRINITY_DN5514_c0_g1_i1:220-726(-)
MCKAALTLGSVRDLLAKLVNQPLAERRQVLLDNAAFESLQDILLHALTECEKQEDYCNAKRILDAGEYFYRYPDFSDLSSVFPQNLDANITNSETMEGKVNDDISDLDFMHVEHETFQNTHNVYLKKSNLAHEKNLFLHQRQLQGCVPNAYFLETILWQHSIWRNTKT